jgi:predicted MFS family arabinose efflux permease
VLGGFLFQIGGWQSPFFLMGGLLFLVFLVALFIFPKPILNETNKQDKNYTKVSLKIFPLLKIARFNVNLLMIFSGTLSYTFIEPSIQLHLLPVNYSKIFNFIEILNFPS